MQIEQTPLLDYNDVLIRPKRSEARSRKDVSLSRTFTFKHTGVSWSGVPIVASNMSTIGTLEMAKALSPLDCCVCLHKFYPYEELIEQLQTLPPDLSIVSLGTSDEDFLKFHQLHENLIILRGLGIRFACIDVANGYTTHFCDRVKIFREKYPEVALMAGNVCTPEMVQELILSGVDVCKVGIGNGSHCLTRKITGVGYPQLSAVIECADAAHGLGGLICADGGCNTPADICKAFGAGADFVMIGGMFAGHEEAGGEIVQTPDGPKKECFGMSSQRAMESFHGGKDWYRASEGKQVLHDQKGSVVDTVLTILGGLRSACTYVGANSLKDLSKCTTFVRVNRTHNTYFGDDG